MAAGGEGSRYIRFTGEPSLSHTLANVKIEVLTAPANWPTRSPSKSITQQIKSKHYADYSIIIYVFQAQVLRGQ